MGRTMTRLTICSPCQTGDHDRHYRVVQAVPEGVIGGSICTCEGECVDGRYKSKELRRIANLMVRMANRKRISS